uniref:Uncharacterized protein n=1 Tax=Octopus bimaculoides TaxID=37653 RepID=A0A0L8H8Z0_OCTBM
MYIADILCFSLKPSSSRKKYIINDLNIKIFIKKCCSTFYAPNWINFFFLFGSNRCL